MENGLIHDFNAFCDQLNDIRIKFHKWDSCEKTIGLYYLMAEIPFANARFLHNALEQTVAANLSYENEEFEKNANDYKFINNFLLEQPQIALSLILDHLPLLKPGNKEAADSFLKTIRKVLSEFMVPPLKFQNECVEIMSYVYIHPAFSHEDKTSLKNLVKGVFNKIGHENFMQFVDNANSLESAKNECQDNVRRMNRRSQSLIPGPFHSKDCTPFSQETFKDIWSSTENLYQAYLKPRSYSLSSEKSLRIDSTNLQSSMSDTRLQDLILMNNRAAMKSIITWLKSLRLHKYSWLFNNLTFNQMLNLKEDTLETIGITKGARQKLLLNIAKLRERSTMLSELENDVMNGGDLTIAMKKLKSILQSPLQLTMGEDLQSLFVKVTGKVYTQLLMLRQPPNELLMAFSSLCERAETMEDGFTDEQKRKLNMWKNQLLKADSFPVYNADAITLKSQRSQVNNKYYLSKLCSISSSYTKKSSSFPNMKNNICLHKHRHSVGSVSLQNQIQSLNQYQHVLKHSYQSESEPSNSFFTLKQELFSEPGESHKSIQTSQSTDIESSLESLCIQMMEHALGP